MIPDFITEKEDSWDFLRRTELPIFLYGMGDGAEKILRVFDKYGIPVAGFFASDEFVRGHTFKGHLVHKLSQIEALIDDFIVVLAFGAGYKSLYDRIFEIDKRHRVIAPDVPVAGDGLFTYKYCLENGEKLRAVYDMLADEESRRTYANVVNFKISGKIHYLNACPPPEEGLVPLGRDEVFVDMGAYNGDTALKFLDSVKGEYRHLYAFEPSPRNFRRLQKNLPADERITLFNAAAWDSPGDVEITPGDGRMCRTGKGIPIPAMAADDAVPEQATLIKLDVEGAERRAILGAKRHISGGAKVVCALYHRNEDIFDLPLLLRELNPELRLYVRHKLYLPAWETCLYAKR